MRTRLFLLLILVFLGFQVEAQENDSIRFRQAHFREKHVSIYFVPVNQDLFNSQLGNISTAFSQAQIELDCYIEKPFQYKDFQSFLNPPADSSRYSQQMKSLRNAYFKANPGKDAEGIYCFIVPSFQNTTIHAFSVPAKSLLFVTHPNDSTFQQDVIRHTGYALGLETSELTNNLMHLNGGNQLTWEQCWQLRSAPFSFSLYDDYEFVQTNNGLAAYCIWLENKNGEIAVDSLNPIESIFRPYKRNYLSYLLKIDNPLFRPLFAVKKITICPVHLLTVLLTLILVIIVRRKANNRIEESKFFKRQYLRLLKFMSWCLAIAVVYLCFWAVNWYYENSVLRAPHLKAMKGNTSTDLLKAMNDEQVFSHIDDDKVSTMTYVKKEEEWYAIQEKKVLNFDIRKVSDSSWIMSFSGSSGVLDVPTLGVKHLAYSHYIVFRYRDNEENVLQERVYNHLGIELTKSLKKRDPAKRILIFVNGYRPVSTSNSFEHNLADIQKKGVEYPETKNYLYTYDRYNYWRPWNQIDLLFQQRINPAETWYADGHHSVSTSNHFSLVQFAQSSSMYPLTCKGKHTCQYTIITGNKRVKTTSLLDQRPNPEGFAHRRNRGHIAGKNLRAVLNELPNESENDTLYIVAHSMGYAYALGILDEMRGKIQLGGFYILAPENAGSGRVKRNEWQEVWQYGTKLYGKGKNASCEQDGVAPQVKAAGLKEENRVYFPESEQKKMGFFKSHFVGYYTWIFDIPVGEKGAIRQR